MIKTTTTTNVNNNCWLATSNHSLLCLKSASGVLPWLWRCYPLTISPRAGWVAFYQTEILFASVLRCTAYILRYFVVVRCGVGGGGGFLWSVCWTDWLTCCRNFPDQWQWLKKQTKQNKQKQKQKHLLQWYTRVFRFCGRYFRENSWAIKNETNQCNTDMSRGMAREKRKWLF